MRPSQRVLLALDPPVHVRHKQLPVTTYMNE